MLAEFRQPNNLGFLMVCTEDFSHDRDDFKNSDDCRNSDDYCDLCAQKIIENGITDVVFDLHLLVDWDARRTLESDYPDYIGEVLFSYEPEWGFEFHEALREAAWSSQRALESFSEHHGPAVTWLYRLYFKNFSRGFLGERASFASLARDLISKGVRVWALGNASQEWIDCARETCPILGEINGVSASYESHLRKPNIMIYRDFLSKNCLRASSTVFVESDLRSLKTAQRIECASTKLFML